MSGNIFGPVPSRRLGRSLGVDLVPYKTCSFDCVYCELGPTTNLTKQRRPYAKVDAICNDLIKNLTELKGEVDFITLAGSGEPTLNSDIGRLIQRIKSITDHPLAILTNSSLISDPCVRKELIPLDLIVPSLDAANSETFKRINRPFEGIAVDEIIEGLIYLREEFHGQIWLEVLLVKDLNDNDLELDLIKNAIKRIRPDRVQLNTIFRPPSVEGSEPVSETRLKAIEKSFGRIAQSVGSTYKKGHATISSRSLNRRALILLQRRPCTITDICNALCMRKTDVISLLEKMLEDGSIYKMHHQGTIFFKAKG